MNSVLVEFRLATRSRWTISLAIILAAAMGFSFWALLDQTASANTVLRMMRETGSIQSDRDAWAWIATAKEAEDLRSQAALLAKDAGANHALGVLGSLGPLLGIMWGASLVGSEYGWRTVRLKAAHTGWAEGLASKAAVIAGVAICLAVAFALSGLALQPLIRSVVIRSYPWVAAVSTARSPAVAPQVLAVALGCFLFSLMGALLALAFRGTAGALVTGLALMLFVQGAVGWWWLPENAYSALLSQTIRYPAGGLIGSAPTVSTGAPPFHGYPVVVTVMWTVILLGAMWSLARRQEIP